VSDPLVENLVANRRVKYVVAMCGDLNRGERMNVAVLAWDTEQGLASPVSLRLLKDWTRVHAAFPSSFGDMIQKQVETCLTDIRTYADFKRTLDKTGPYTPFEFTEERGSLESPENTVIGTAQFFLRQLA
jgi:hypothetical protein